MVNLTDLKSKRAAMTQGEWVEAEDGEVYTDDPCKIIVRISRAPVAANVTGIVATHNAADVLIEIAESALIHFGHHDEATISVAYDRLRAALAKVQP